MGFLDKIKGAVAGKGDQVDSVIDKAADVIDDKTGNKHSDTIDSIAEKAKDAVDELDPDTKG